MMKKDKKKLKNKMSKSQKTRQEQDIQKNLNLLDIIAEIQYQALFKNDGSIPEKHFLNFVKDLTKNKAKYIKNIKFLAEIELRTTHTKGQ